MTSSFPTDSYLFITGDDAEQTEWPATRFPEYTDEHLTQFVDRLWAMSNGDLTSGLPVLSAAGLYTLVVVLARAAGFGHGSWSADRRIAINCRMPRRPCSPNCAAATVGPWETTRPGRFAGDACCSWSARSHPCPNRVARLATPEDAWRLPLLWETGVAAGFAARSDLALLRMRPIRRPARIRRMPAHPGPGTLGGPGTASIAQTR